MNVRTDPSLLETGIHPLPADAELPIRSIFLPEDKLRKLGESLAKGEIDFFYGLGEEFDFHQRNKDNARHILEVYRVTNDAQARGETVTPAAQWLLDNHYLVEETIYQIRRDLPRRFYRELPTIDVGGRQIPRALALAWIYVAHVIRRCRASSSRPSSRATSRSTRCKSANCGRCPRCSASC